MTVPKKLGLLLSLSFSIFLLVLFVKFNLPVHDTFVSPVTGLPVFERLLPAGTLIDENSVALLPDSERPAYAVGYSLGSQSGVALVIWDSARQRYVTATNRLFANGVSGSAAKPPALAIESLGKDQPWIIVVRSAVGERADGVFFAVREANDLSFVSMQDSQGQTRPAFFLSGPLPANGGSGVAGMAAFELQDINGDGLSEAMATTRSFQADDSGAGLATSVDIYLWRDAGFVYDSELSRILTKASGIFPEPPQR